MKWVKAGFCFNHRSANQTRHLWIALTEPEGDPLAVAIANITTYKDGDDTTVVLGVGEHAFIKHKTIVNYAEAKVVDATRIEQLIDTGLISPHGKEPYCTPNFLKKIRDGVSVSPFVTPRFQAFCKDKF
jgi:hypothetical protein